MQCPLILLLLLLLQYWSDAVTWSQQQLDCRLQQTCQTDAAKRRCRCYVTTTTSSSSIALLCDVKGAESPMTSVQRYLAGPAGRRPTPLQRSPSSLALFHTSVVTARLSNDVGSSACPSFMATDALQWNRHYDYCRAAGDYVTSGSVHTGRRCTLLHIHQCYIMSDSRPCNGLANITARWKLSDLLLPPPTRRRDAVSKRCLDVV